jgi:hypothetical protein
MKMNTLKRLAAIGAGLAVIGSVALPHLPSASAATGTNATQAIDWLEKELGNSGDRFQASFNGESFDDLGLTIDALLAIASAGRNADAQANESVAYVAEHASDYAAPGTDRYAGALGKLMVLVQARGQATTNVDGLNLENEVRGRLQSNGRFTDKSDFGDFSNGIGQAFDMIALARTPDKIPNTATAWLLAQQCADGGFRSDYSEGTTCGEDDESTTDATSFALLALKFANLTQADAPKIEKAVKFLNDNKNATSGLVGNNTNSAGLAASAFRSYGFVPAANGQADKIDDLQLASGVEKGAIALNKADFDGGVTDAKRAIWQRATTQAVLALGLPSYIDRGTINPVDPKPHSSSSTGTAKAGDSITMTGGGFQAGETVNATVESDPVNVGSATGGPDGEVSITFTLPASIPAGSHTIKLTGATSGIVVSQALTVTAPAVSSTSSTSTTAASGATTTTVRISRTGSDAENQAMLAGLFLALGTALVLAARQRRVIYPFKK